MRNLAHKINFKNVQCSYCQSGFKVLPHNTEAKHFIIACLCDEFPVIDNIVYLTKTDHLVHKRIIDKIKNGGKYSPIWTALSSQAKTHRLIGFLAYYFYKEFNVVLPLQTLLHIFRIVGPARSWFDYLLKSSQRNTLKTAVQSIKDVSTSQEIIVDIGAGIGSFMSEYQGSKNEPRQFIEIDKSFLSLLIARMYQKQKNVIFICGDIEVGLPIQKASVSTVLFLDCFAWIYDKGHAIQESHRVLKKNGFLQIINIHEELLETKWWGFGIQQIQLKKMLDLYFRKTQFFDNTLTKENSISKLSPDFKLGYSCRAKKQ